MKVKGICLGCKVNTYENEFILSSFKDKGYDIINDNSNSEVFSKQSLLCCQQE